MAGVYPELRLRARASQMRGARRADASLPTPLWLPCSRQARLRAGVHALGDSRRLGGSWCLSPGESRSAYFNWATAGTLGVGLVHRAGSATALMLFGSVGRARVALAGVSFLRIAGAAARLTSAPLIFFFIIQVDRSERRRSRSLGGAPRRSTTRFGGRESGGSRLTGWRALTGEPCLGFLVRETSGWRTASRRSRVRQRILRRLLRSRAVGEVGLGAGGRAKASANVSRSRSRGATPRRSRRSTTSICQGG